MSTSLKRQQYNILKSKIFELKDEIHEYINLLSKKEVLNDCDEYLNLMRASEIMLIEHYSRSNITIEIIKRYNGF